MIECEKEKRQKRKGENVLGWLLIKAGLPSKALGDRHTAFQQDTDSKQGSYEGDISLFEMNQSQHC